MESPKKIDTVDSSEAPKDPSRAWKRSVLLINPKFQLTFLFYMLIIAATIIIVLYVANVYFFKRSYEAGQTLGLPPDHIYFTFIDNQRGTMKWIFLLASGITMINLTFWGLYLSHRVAGPIYRLRKHMVELSEGKSNRDVNFRTNDFFPELADAFNQFVKDFKSK